MKKKVELPLVEPIYGTYHYQGSGAAAIYANPSIRNWYLNEVMILKCTKRFLSGYTSPEIDIVQSSWHDNPHFEKRWYAMQFINGYINPIIRELIDNGYYVCFDEIDDFYMEGKSWYKVRHRNHDGMICGYNQEEKTYSIYAYDSKWVYRKFSTPQKCFNAGRESAFKRGKYGYIGAIKPKLDNVEFEPDSALKKLVEYLDSSLKKYPKAEGGEVFGIAVHDYIAMYVDKLFDGSIPYEQMDSRVFRLIWEHKNAMLERLVKMENTLKLNPKSSSAYKKVVDEADTMRMLYASYHMKRKDSILPILRKKLMLIKTKELVILKQFVKKAGGKIKK